MYIFYLAFYKKEVSGVKKKKKKRKKKRKKKKKEKCVHQDQPQPQLYNLLCFIQQSQRSPSEEGCADTWAVGPVSQTQAGGS